VEVDPVDQEAGAVADLELVDPEDREVREVAGAGADLELVHRGAEQATEGVKEVAMDLEVAMGLGVAMERVLALAQDGMLDHEF
jgi:hypothetical protein